MVPSALPVITQSTSSNTFHSAVGLSSTNNIIQVCRGQRWLNIEADTRRTRF